MEKLIVGNTVIEYELKSSTKAKKIRITINNNNVKVTVPKGITMKEAKDFVEEKKEWIFKHLENYKNFQSEKEAKQFVAGEKFLFLGRGYTLRTKTWDKSRAQVDFDAATLWVTLPEALPKVEWPEKVKEALVNWYKIEAKKVFKVKLDHYAKLMGLQYQGLRIKEQKTRWGSCSGKGNINLNWRVIMAPTPVVDYLVVHELAHLKHMNHSQDFWHFVAGYVPGYEQWKKWLKDNGKDLVI